MKLKMRLAAAAALVAGGAAPSLMAATAASAAEQGQAPPPAQIQVCGFYTTGNQARYAHCVDNYTLIWVDTWDNRGEGSRCVPPLSDVYLGPTWIVSWAHSFGTCN